MTQLEAAKVVAVLMAAFPNNKATSATAKIYEQLLVDLDASVATAAVERLLATATFMPAIAEIRAACADLACGEKRAGGDAWGDVLDAVGRFGRYRTPAFTDPAVSRAVAALGWVEICDSTNHVADRARFIELYNHLATSERRELIAGQLPAARAYRAELEARGGEGSPFARVLKLSKGDV